MKWSKLSEREIDALIAENVFDWEWRKSDSKYNPRRWLEGPLGQVGAHRGGDFEKVFHEWLPHYSTDIAAAWRVLENFTYPIIRFDQGLAKWVASVSVGAALSMHSGRVEKKTFEAQAETAPEAICLAALKACGIDIEPT